MSSHHQTRGRDGRSRHRRRFGALGRPHPISRVWGLDRGRPVDRYYIERFLDANSAHIRGRVLEFGSDAYARRFGPPDITVDVWNVISGHPQTTIVGDLTRGAHVPAASFDCVICTQTLQLIYNTRAAILTLHRILKPAGTLLLTLPGTSQISRFDMDRWGDHWRFTASGIGRLLEERFSPPRVKVEACGNLLATVAFLWGLAAEELSPSELEHRDPRYELLLTVVATR